MCALCCSIFRAMSFVIPTSLESKLCFFPKVMYGCESCTVKKAEKHQRNEAFKLVLKTLENPLDNMEIKPVNPKGNQLWVFIGRNDAEAEAPILWPPDVESWLTGKDLNAGKDWGQEKGVTEDETSWMASPTQWTWVWANSGRWWRTGKPGVLPSMGWQRGRHDWATTTTRDTSTAFRHTGGTREH